MRSSLLRTVLRPSTQCIWLSSSRPWSVNNFKVKLGQGLSPPYLPSAPFLCCKKMLQILVIGVNCYRFFRSQQVMSPFLESLHYRLYLFLAHFYSFRVDNVP